MAARGGARRWPGWVLALLMLGGAALAARALLAELGIAQLAQGAALAQAGRGGAAALLAGCGTAQEPRALLLCGAGQAARARALPQGPAQRTLLAEAGALAARLTRQAPGDGRGWALRAYVAALGGDEAGATAALARSYHLAPFLDAEAPWRLWYGSHHLARLSAADERRLVEEALWYQEFGERQAAEVRAALAGTPLYIGVVLRAPNWNGPVLEGR